MPFEFATYIPEDHAMRCLPSTLVLLLSVFLTGSAWAGEDLGDQSERRGRKGELRQKILDKFDADGDGRLNEDERAAARKEMQARRGGEERGGEKSRRSREGRRERGAFDGPQERGPEERRRPNDQGLEGRGGPGGRRPPSPEKMFDRFDANEDGQLSRGEFRKLAEAERRMRDRMRGGPSARDFGNRGPDGDRGFRGERGPKGDRGSFGPRGGDGQRFKRSERPQQPPLEFDSAGEGAPTEAPST
ncbi:MAG: collagen-like protein [Pirellulales bacterium]|nr:collagen-like protein [Pirellulales bacterium]